MSVSSFSFSLSLELSLKHNVISGPTKIYDKTVPSNTYVEGDYFICGTVNQLVLMVTAAFTAPATKLLIKIQSTEGTFDYDYAPPDLPNAAVVGSENQIPLHADVYVLPDSMNTCFFYVPFSGQKFRILAKTDAAGGSVDVIMRTFQVIV